MSLKLFLIFLVQTLTVTAQFFPNDWNIEGRIIGGHDIDITYRPYMASLGKIFSDGSHHHFCAGSLITEKHILTAAHCYMSPETINLGAKMGVTDISEPGVILRVIKFKKHHHFNSVTLNNDIAVVTLECSVSLSPKIYVVALPVVKPVMEDKMGEVSGWGYTKEEGPVSKILQTVRVPIMSARVCRRRTAYGNKITDKMICAGYINGGKDSCRGDSGGPLVYDGEQIGVVSWGQGCSRESYPGVYTDVSQFTNWIHWNTF